MRENYLVSEWALIRRNELVDIPNQFKIHPDFLQTLSHEEFESAYREIGEMFYRMYSDIADAPERFGLPLYKADEYDYFSNQAREARTAPRNLFFLCSGCLPAVILRKMCSLRIRRKSEK